MKKFLLLVATFAAVLAISACKPDPVVDKENTNPTITGETSISLFLGDTYDPLSGVTASDTEDGDLTSAITVVANPVDTSVSGVYTVVLKVEDSEGASATLTVQVSVAVPLANYLSGVDLSKLPIESKGILFAAAERYLLENIYAGVPLYTGAARVIFSDRVQLYSETYNGVMGFGTAFSQFSADDSTVYMNSSQMGNAGEYTWRASYTTDPVTLNPWISDDSATSDFIGQFTGGLYEMHFDASKTGYQIDPSLAASEPVAVNGEEINGKTYATVWQIPLKDGLTWTFHPGIDTTGFDTTLDATDYMWTWKTAMDQNWFRARTGGGDFVSEGIKNAAEYLNGTATWDQVGLRYKDNDPTTNTLELEFTTDKSAFDIKYMFAGASLTPIQKDLYDAAGFDQDGTSLYGTVTDGTAPLGVASSGIYYFDTFTLGQLLTFKKNTSYVDADLYHYTGYQYRYIKDQDQRFAEWEAGRLDSASVPQAKLDQYFTDPRVKVSPDPTTWRLQINSFGTTANRDAFIAEHPEIGLSEDFVPEPILMYTEMRQALYYGFDRYEAAVNVVKTYLPAYTYFTSTYFLDAESGTSVRGTDAGQAILDDFGGGSYAYYPDAALALFKQAVAKGIADGYYEAGTEAAPTVISLSLTYASSGSTSAQAMVAEIKQQYEDLFQDTENHVNVVIDVADVDFPNNYYDYMMVANTDLGIGGIQGSLLDAPSFLDVFDDDNRGGFTLNWGIDTHTANIPVTYTNLDGDVVTEIWGYNALVEALNGKTYIKDGVEQTAWSDLDSLVNAYLDMNGEVKDTASDGATLAAYILGVDDLATLASDEGFDALSAQIVVTESGKNQLFVVSETNGNYELYGQYGLATNAFDAIAAHADANWGYGDYLVSATGPLTDAEVAANAYIAASYGYTTVAEVATDEGIPAQYTEVYAVSWDDGDQWDDAYVVLHIGDYYIGWDWL